MNMLASVSVEPAARPASGCGCGTCPLPDLCSDESHALPDVLVECAVERRRLSAGENLYMAGEPRAAVWVVSQGWLKTCALDEHGAEQVLAFHGPGDVLGLERLDQATYEDFAVAVDAAHVCRVPVPRLTRRLADTPALWKDIVAVAAAQIARAHEIHRVLGQLQMNQRLAWFLLDQAGGPDGCDLIIRLHMQRQDIASFLGMTLESVSRGLGALQREGLVEVCGRMVRIRDRIRLRQRLASHTRAAA